MDILFVLGTKAQFIKTIPMINYAISSNHNVTLIDLKQHPEKTKLLLSKIISVFTEIIFFVLVNSRILLSIDLIGLLSQITSASR